MEHREARIGIEGLGRGVMNGTLAHVVRVSILKIGAKDLGESS